MQYNAKAGLYFFGVYAAFYLAFVVLNAFWPQVMEAPMAFGLNWAVSSGFGLIGFAFLLAIGYGLICRTDSGSQGPSS